MLQIHPTSTFKEKLSLLPNTYSTYLNHSATSESVDLQPPTTSIRCVHENSYMQHIYIMVQLQLTIEGFHNRAVCTCYRSEYTHPSVASNPPNIHSTCFSVNHQYLIFCYFLNHLPQVWGRAGGGDENH